MAREDEEQYCGGYWDMADDLAEEFDAQEVVPNLYIGSISAANSVSQLKDHNITHILSISTNPPQVKDEFQTLCIHIEDEAKKDISSYFQQCHGFIENGRKLGGILIHCTAGVSRSATVVISYLMSIFFKPFLDCFQYLRKIRPCIQPNHGFINQLISYETQLLKNSIQICNTTPIASAANNNCNIENEKSL
ncbi:hypothetical protein DICPUDRAFT_148247 [Dictyostelium purpureum]|uniref:Uncharacterized protein n=1 Tax=Dictyostelium purpureum TaxID=5786 RepID=F0ZAM4_DICPU|nr:uncharacterized protein DICPUDRAFT_148247 [Dictyostelium purpureum]EGC39024.1 hypothetical protein DICPUDRAFT_148247 [Dictyostelium purpureum]|eukprot:XP_003284477.1 hypothetical protein DICPUDRAFT_148247 [Dictyostelium purpureum]